MAPAYEAVDETEEVTMFGTVPEENEEAVPEVPEGSPILTAGAPESVAETDGIEVTEGRKAIATEESLVAECADSDYPAMVMYDGAIYKDSGEKFIGEVSEDGLLQVTSYTNGEPAEDGQQNFDRLSETKFFVLDDNTIVVRIGVVDGEWRLFTKQ